MLQYSNRTFTEVLDTLIEQSRHNFIRAYLEPNGTQLEHDSGNFGALFKSIISYFKSIIGSGLPTIIKGPFPKISRHPGYKEMINIMANITSHGMTIHVFRVLKNTLQI